MRAECSDNSLWRNSWLRPRHNRLKSGDLTRCQLRKSPSSLAVVPRDSQEAKELEALASVLLVVDQEASRLELE